MNSKPLSKKTIISLKALGHLIKSARLEKNISQEELASRLGVQRLTIINIEKGNTKVSIGAYFEAAAIVGIPLMGEDTHQFNLNSNFISGLIAILPKRAGRKKTKLDDDF